MDRSFEVALSVLAMLARCNEQLIEFAADVRAEGGVRSVSSRLECRDYRSGPMLEGYVDAEIDSGKAITWWLEGRWSNENCQLKASVLIVADEGQDTLREREAVRFATFDDLERELFSAVDWLKNQKAILSEAR